MTLELKQNNDGKYVVFDDDAISTNLTASVNYNGNVIEMVSYPYKALYKKIFENKAMTFCGLDIILDLEFQLKMKIPLYTKHYPIYYMRKALILQVITFI